MSPLHSRIDTGKPFRLTTNLVGPQVTQLSQALEALGLSRRLFPCRHYAGHAQGRSRHFPRKLPLAVEEDRATFVYVDPGRDTDSELPSWGAAHARLWAALRARKRPVHVVAGGGGPPPRGGGAPPPEGGPPPQRAGGGGGGGAG
ncbi:MAG: hypothetical protein OXT71_11920 [Acidobacteriota bacterium]|nr:hypothetical protein [Acidobacteriota bacterium]